jgi:hypothetical protein
MVERAKHQSDGKREDGCRWRRRKAQDQRWRWAWAWVRSVPARRVASSLPCLALLALLCLFDAHFPRSPLIRLRCVWRAAAQTGWHGIAVVPVRFAVWPHPHSHARISTPEEHCFPPSGEWPGHLGSILLLDGQIHRDGFWLHFLVLLSLLFQLGSAVCSKTSSVTWLMPHSYNLLPPAAQEFNGRKCKRRWKEVGLTDQYSRGQGPTKCCADVQPGLRYHDGWLDTTAILSQPHLTLQFCPRLVLAG